MLTMRGFLDTLKKQHPEDLLVIEDEVNPANFEATAILQHLENADGHIQDITDHVFIGDFRRAAIRHILTIN